MFFLRFTSDTRIVNLKTKDKGVVLLKVSFKILIAAICLFVCISVGVYIADTVADIKEYKKQIEILNKEIGLLDYENKNMTSEMQKSKEEKDRLTEEKNDLIKKLNDLKSEYSDLSELYKKETQKVVFSPDNVLTPSNTTSSKLEGVLSKTGLNGLSDHYLKAEELYGVNAIFLVALTAEESGWGNSNRAKKQNNLSGYAVYSSSSRGTSFSSKGESIMATARLLKRDYLSSDGKYYNGVSISSINKRYCPNDGGRWSKNITQISNEIVSKINSR